MVDSAGSTPELPLAGGAPASTDSLNTSATSAPVPAEVVAQPAPTQIEPTIAPTTEPPASNTTKTAAETPSLLEEIGGDKDKKAAEPVEPKPEEVKVPEAKPAEVKPAEEVSPEKVAEVKPTEPAKLEPISYEYAIPESIKMDEATKGSFHTALDSFRADPAKGAQPLIDLHNQAMTDYANHIAAEQQRIFSETRKAWRTEVMSDEQLGGSGHQTTMKAIARMRDLAVPEKDRDSFNEFLRVTGAGDHPAFLRAMHNFARYFDEPSLPQGSPKPPPTNGRAPGSRAKILYDNPRSNNSGRQ